MGRGDANGQNADGGDFLSAGKQESPPPRFSPGDE